jgi:peptidoglycan hydrolase-like protein with peptidoglycan-binding domain
MNIVTSYISGHNRPGKKINVRGVVVHWTANEGKGADAKANRNYFNSTDRYASAHVCVDDTNFVECLPWRKGEAEEAWHVGATSYKQACLSALNTTYPNDCTIGLEICVNSDGDFKKAYANGVAGIAMMLKEHGLGIDKLFRHFDVTGKNCPAFFVDETYAQKYFGMSASAAYSKFRSDVSKALGGSASAPTTEGFYRNITFGAKGDDVKYLQTLLVKLGYKLPKYGIDGDYGQDGGESVMAVKAFQKDHGLTVDGLCGPATQKAILAASAKKDADDKAAAQVIYRVRKSWDDAASQLGAYTVLDSAKDLADQHKSEGYQVFDPNGKVVYDPTPAAPAPAHMYRVRKTWADASSQIGAFSDLDNAKALADKNPGYIVFDENGKALYQFVPEVVKPAPAPTPAPAPKPAEPTPAPTPAPAPTTPAVDHTGHHDIMGKSVVVAEQMVAFVKAVNPNFDEAIAPAYLKVGEKYGIRGDVAFAQSVIETGYFKFDGGTAVTPDQHNYCGMGVTSKGMKGNSFATIEDGVTAQMQHLLAYASKNAIPSGDAVLDPRFSLVSRGVAPHWEDLNNRWAMNSNYGQSILAVYEKLKATPVPAPKPEPAPVVPPVKEEPPVVEQPAPTPVEETPAAPVEAPEVVAPAPVEDAPNPDEKINGGLVNRVLQAILDFFKNMFGKKN